MATLTSDNGDIKVYLMLLTTPCGHEYKIDESRLQGSGEATTDCSCGALLMLVWTPDSVTISNFHRWMHERDPRWPADGAGTGYLEI